MTDTYTTILGASSSHITRHRLRVLRGLVPVKGWGLIAKATTPLDYHDYLHIHPLIQRVSLSLSRVIQNSYHQLLQATLRYATEYNDNGQTRFFLPIDRFERVRTQTRYRQRVGLRRRRQEGQSQYQIKIIKQETQERIQLPYVPIPSSLLIDRGKHQDHGRPQKMKFSSRSCQNLSMWECGMQSRKMADLDIGVHRELRLMLLLSYVCLYLSIHHQHARLTRFMCR